MMHYENKITRIAGRLDNDAKTSTWQEYYSNSTLMKRKNYARGALECEMGAFDDPGNRMTPDDGVVIGLAGVAVPDNGGLALVSNADGSDFGAAGVGERGAHDFPSTLPDLERIVLDPAELWVKLAVFELVGGDGAIGMVE